LYADNDGDGFGSGNPVACGVANHTDCNDDDPAVHTPITYYKDNDHDGFGDPGNSTSECSPNPPSGYVGNNTDCDDGKLLYKDNDGDGFGSGSPVACGVAGNTDCNDGDASVHTSITYYKDNDNDGFGNPANTTTVCSSSPPSGYIGNNTDCDDTKLLYKDNDGDGFGAGSPIACGVENNTDCNDNDATVHVPVTYYKDNDNDGFGNAGNTTSVCSSTPPTGYVSNSTDCNDGNGAIHPGAVEVCGNNIDDDCDNQVDEGCTTTCTNATGLTTTNITAHSATLNWTASVNPAQWQIQYKKVSTGAKWINIKLAGSARSVNISGLLGNQTYNWHIRAKCGKTWTSYSSVKSFKTLSVQVSSIAQQAAPLKNVDKEKSSALWLYPNPSNGQFVIDLRVAENLSANAKIELVNMMGQTVSTENGSISNGRLQKNISMSSSLAQGIYLVKIIVNGKIYVAKLIYAK